MRAKKISILFFILTSIVSGCGLSKPVTVEELFTEEKPEILKLTLSNGDVHTYHDNAVSASFHDSTVLILYLESGHQETYHRDKIVSVNEGVYTQDEKWMIIQWVFTPIAAVGIVYLGIMCLFW